MNTEQPEDELQHCLDYCLEQNGMSYCKNCGLDAEMIKRHDDILRSKILVEVELALEDYCLSSMPILDVGVMMGYIRETLNEDTPQGVK